MSLASAFRAALVAGDVTELRGLWAQAAPHLPPVSDADAETVMHRARTEAASIPLRLRAWSHRWLEERGLPSGLPDHLKPRAERLYPRILEGVGLSVGFTSPILKPAAPLIRKAMEDAVSDAYAEGRTEPAFVKARMAEARASETRRLFGEAR